MDEITNIDISFNGTITVTYKENDVTRFISILSKDLLTLLKQYSEQPRTEA